MISIKKCRKFLKETSDKLSDSDIKRIRGSLYCLIEKEIELFYKEKYKNMANNKTINKK